MSGWVVQVHTADVNYKGYTHHASAEEPQYEIKSDRTEHIALHKGAALKLIGRRRVRDPGIHGSQKVSRG